MKRPDPDISNDLVPDAFGVASWRTVLETCTYAQMRRLRKRLLFVPTTIVEVDDDQLGFEYLPNQAIETTVSDDPRHVGEAALRALERSS